MGFGYGGLHVGRKVGTKGVVGYLVFCGIFVAGRVGLLLTCFVGRREGVLEGNFSVGRREGETLLVGSLVFASFPAALVGEGLLAGGATTG